MRITYIMAAAEYDGLSNLCIANMARVLQRAIKNGTTLVRMRFDQHLLQLQNRDAVPGDLMPVIDIV